MSSYSCLLCDVVPLMAEDALLVLNSAADPFIPFVSRQLQPAMITLAEDNIAILQEVRLGLADWSREHQCSLPRIEHFAFHDYVLHQPMGVHDIAVMNLLYQPANAWSLYGLRLALLALKPDGRLYVVGAKDRGILTIAKHMRDLFGNVETLVISKGQRVVCAHKSALANIPTLSSVGTEPSPPHIMDSDLSTHIFAANKLDEGTRLLLDVLPVRAADIALDLGCGAGFIGLHIAHLADKGQVTMVDASLAAVAASQRAVKLGNLNNIRVLPSNGAQAVITERFDLVVTNPPFHQGGIQTTSIAERFIQDAATVLQPKGRFYLVANRFLKYETALTSCFKQVQEVGGNSRYKVLFASNSRSKW
jgi:16S rRNA (guanine1207-N2)-methyltransferase